MTPPYREHVARIVLWTIVGLFALGEYVMRFRSRRRRGRRVEAWSIFVVVGSVAAGVIGAVALADSRIGEITAGSWPLFVLGLVLLAAGLVVRQWAIATLGRFFTIDVQIHADQRVVDRGPYRWVRHPSYTGLVLFFVGLGLALTNWCSLLVLAVVPTAGLLVRIRSEEHALLAAFGDDYRRYAAARARLFPGVW